MASPDKIAAKQQARAQAQQRQEQIQSAPAEAALIKAHAAANKTGGLPPQQQVQAPLPAPPGGPPQ